MKMITRYHTDIKADHNKFNNKAANCNKCIEYACFDSIAPTIPFFFVSHYYYILDFTTLCAYVSNKLQFQRRRRICPCFLSSRPHYQERIKRLCPLFCLWVYCYTPSNNWLSSIISQTVASSKENFHFPRFVPHCSKLISWIIEIIQILVRLDGHIAKTVLLSSTLHKINEWPAQLWPVTFSSKSVDVLCSVRVSFSLNEWITESESDSGAKQQWIKWTWNELQSHISP